MSEHACTEGMLEYVDYLLDGLEGEIRLSERYAIDLDSIAFYKQMLRAAYQRAVERKDGDATTELHEQNPSSSKYC